jgi:hypothetical protein
VWSPGLDSDGIVGVKATDPAIKEAILSRKALITRECLPIFDERGLIRLEKYIGRGFDVRLSCYWHSKPRLMKKFDTFIEKANLNRCDIIDLYKEVGPYNILISDLMPDTEDE